MAGDGPTTPGEASRLPGGGSLCRTRLGPQDGVQARRRQEREPFPRLEKGRSGSLGLGEITGETSGGACNLGFVGGSEVATSEALGSLTPRPLPAKASSGTPSQSWACRDHTEPREGAWLG